MVGHGRAGRAPPSSAFDVNEHAGCTTFGAMHPYGTAFGVLPIEVLTVEGSISARNLGNQGSAG